MLATDRRLVVTAFLTGARDRRSCLEGGLILYGETRGGIEGYVAGDLRGRLRMMRSRGLGGGGTEGSDTEGSGLGHDEVEGTGSSSKKDARVRITKNLGTGIVSGGRSGAIVCWRRQTMYVRPSRGLKNKPYAL